jgi:hypothetical protein
MSKLLCTAYLRIGNVFYSEGSIVELMIEESVELLKSYPNNFIPYDENGELALDYAQGRKLMPSDSDNNAFGASGNLGTIKNPSEE